MKDKFLTMYEKYKTFILFALFGIPPTLIGFGIYLLLVYPLRLPAYLSSAISWAVMVICSFFLYRKYVFHSAETGPKAILQEFLKFVSMRIVSGLMETGLVFLFVDVLGWHKLLFKILASFAAALLNYLISIIFVFRNRKKHFSEAKRLER